MNKMLKGGDACCAKCSPPKNAGTARKEAGPAGIKNAVAYKPKAKGYSKIKGTISG